MSVIRDESQPKANQASDSNTNHVSGIISVDLDNWWDKGHLGLFDIKGYYHKLVNVVSRVPYGPGPLNRLSSMYSRWA